MSYVDEIRSRRYRRRPRMPEAMDMASLRKGVDEIDLVDTLEYEDQVTQNLRGVRASQRGGR